MKVGWVIHFWLIHDIHFVWLDALIMPVNNPINIFLINSNIVFYMFLSLNANGYLKYH